MVIRLWFSGVLIYMEAIPLTLPLAVAAQIQTPNDVGVISVPESAPAGGAEEIVDTNGSPSTTEK